MPVTAKACVDLIVTDIAVIKVIDRGLVLHEFASGWTLEEIIDQTAASLIIASDIKEMEF